MGLVAASAAASLVGRSAERQWRAQPDPVGPGGLTLPPGDGLVVTTDDGAELAVTVCPPNGRQPDAGAAGRPPAPPTVVLSHCWTGSRLMWAPVAQRLVDAGHRVVLYDQRGHGESTFGAADVAAPAPPPPVAPSPAAAAGRAVGAAPSALAPPAAPAPGARRPASAGSPATRRPDRRATAAAPAVTLSRFGDDLAAVLDHVDAEDVVVAGHSMGGFATMAFACEHPDRLAARVRGLVLVSTAAHGLGAGRFTGAARRLLGSGLPARALRHPRFGLFLMRGVVGGRHPCYSHLTASRDLFLATPPAVTAACFACFADMDLRAGLASVDVPSVVMIGSHDPLTPPTLSRAIVDALPSARIDVLDGAGHLLPLEAPDQVTAAIVDLAA